MLSRRFAPLAAVLIALFLLAGCGDDSGDDKADDTTTSEAVDDTTSSTADETTTSVAAEPTDGEGDQAALTVEDVEALDDFCAVWGTAESSGSTFETDFANATPEQVQQTAQVFNALLVQGIATAPDEIKGDFTAMADSIQTLYALLADYDYDVTALTEAAANDPAVADSMDTMFSGDIDGQIANVEAWVTANC